MTIKEYQNSLAWQEAIALGVALQTLVEELPAEEQNSLAHLVRLSMVDVPAHVGTSLVNQIPADFEPVLRLQSTLTIINSVYPAIETGPAQSGLDALAERMSSPSAFIEMSAPQGNSK